MTAAPVEAIAEAERALGRKLPGALVSLLRTRNGFAFEHAGEPYRLLQVWDQSDVHSTRSTFEDLVRETRSWRETRSLPKDAVVIAVAEDGLMALFLRPDPADASRLAGRVWGWNEDREPFVVAESILHIVAP